MAKTRIYEKKSKTRKHKYTLLPTLTFILVVAGFGFACYYAYDYAIMRQEVYTDEYKVEIDPNDIIEVKVPFGATTKSIAVMLKDLGLVDSVFVFQAMSNINGYDGRYLQGTHLLNHDMKLEDIMIVLSSKPEIIKVTIPEGFTIEKLKARMEELNLIDLYEFDQVENMIDLSEYDIINPKGNRDHRLEGYLFPDTYEFDKNAGEEYIIRRMMRRFEELFNDELIERANEIGMSIDDVVIMASILERESAQYEIRRKISGVFHNRLASEDEALHTIESTACLQYIFARNGQEPKTEITNDDRAIDDSYNTFVYKGLPPGPISCPGIDSIMAALYPEKHNYYYFAAKNDGELVHVFSETLDEFLEVMGSP